MRRVFVAFLISIASLTLTLHAQEVTLPAFTAYVDPDTHAAHIDKEGITGWATADHILWGGSLGTGKMTATLHIQLPKGEKSKLTMTIAGKANAAEIEGTGAATAVSFGDFEIATPGYQPIELAGVSKSGKIYGDILELTLAGPAAKEAFFNLKPRRNAASVHLNYPLPKGGEVACFYNELTARRDPTASYYMACGFSRGYFGMQVNSPTERRIIFSIWDSGNEKVDRKNVAKEDLVSLVAKGDGVEAGSFGNEGTGGHSHLKYMWKTGETQRFLVTAIADGDATIYSGYFYFNQTQKWGLIASFRAPHDGKLLHGLYSFNEDFDGSNGHLQRLCEFANQWIQTTDGKWSELTTAHFTHDATGGKDRRDYGAGVTNEGRFFLSNGGFVQFPMKSETVSRPAAGKQPTDLPAIP